MTPTFLEYQTAIRNTLGLLIPNDAHLALFDFPNYSNVGDSAIWLGELCYLQTLPKVKIVAAEDLSVMSRRLPDLPDGTLILISGGGNLGDLWPQHQALRERLIEHYQHHRIIQLPQSIHFQDKRNEARCRKVFNKHRDFHLLVRDHVSLDFARQIYQGPIHLCPDMALYLGKLSRTVAPSHPIFCLLRSDKEKLASPHSPSVGNTEVACNDWLEEATSLSHQAISWVQKKRIRPLFPHAFFHKTRLNLYNHLAQKRLHRGCNLLCTGRAVITDRLHGHILCTMLEIPHVVLDNIYRKIGNFRDTWNTGHGLCLESTSTNDAIRLAQHLLLSRDDSDA